MNPEITDEDLAKYISFEYINDVKSGSKSISNYKDRENAIEKSYKFALRVGASIHEVYDYRVSCDQAGIENLILSAYMYFGNARSWLDKKEPTEVIIEYRMENSSWRINKLKFDARKEATMDLDTSRVIDKFD